MERRYTFIVNPISGGKPKDGIISLIKKEFDQSCCEIVETKGPGDATRIARESSSDIVVAVGGDGTVSEVAGGLTGSGKALGIIACGSGDGLALHLGLSRNHRKAIVDLKEGRVVPMDYGTLCGKPFFCTCGVGFDALVSWNFANSSSRGLATYIKEALKAWRNFTPGHYVIDIDGRRWEGDAVLINVANVNQWGNNAKIAPRASVTDGECDVTVVTPFSTLDIPALAFRLMTGSFDRSSKVVSLRGREIRIARDHDGPVHYDGDPSELAGPMLVSTFPAALNVVIPKNKINV